MDAYDLVIGADDTLWALSGDFLVRRTSSGWDVTSLPDVLPGMQRASQHIAVDDAGAVLLLVRPSEAAAEGVAKDIRLVRYDGETTSELARLPGEAGFRIADVGPDGSVWLIGGSSEGRYFDRIHVIPSAASPQS